MGAFQLPEVLPENLTELDELRSHAGDEFDAIRTKVADGETPTEEEVAYLKLLAAAIEQIDTAIDTVQAAADAKAAEVNDLISATSARLDKHVEPAEGEDGTEAPADATVVEAAPEAIAAGGKELAKTSFSGLGKRTGTPAPLAGRSESGWVMETTAPGYKPGKVGLKDIALGISNMQTGSRSSQARANRPDKGSYAVQVLARLERGLEVIDDSHALVAAIENATDESKLTGGSLTAAGGWCAPSETLYDFCDVPDASDLISLPEITINRGGVRWPVEPDMTTILDEFQFFFTETELEAVDGEGNPTAIKECVEVPCTDEFEELRLNAVGYCVEAGILQNQGWPELVEWFQRTLAQEHLRAISRRTINDIVTGSTPLTIGATTQLGAIASILNSMELMAIQLRLDKGAPRGATVEALVPSWVLGVMRADYANRSNGDFSLADAKINGWFSERSIVPQWLGDYQTRLDGQVGDLGVTPVLVYPSTVQVVMYLAGTWFRSLSNVIELGVQYPRELLRINRFSRFFTEDAIAVGKRCNRSLAVTIPICPSGAVGLREAIACNLTDAPGAA